MNKKPRIFLSLCETAGYFTHLEAGLQELGCEARTGFVRHHAFDYKKEENTSFFHKLILLNSKALFAKRNIALRIPFFVLYRFILLPMFFIQCLFKYDVFIFGFRKTFLPFLWDLPILKLLNKKIIFVFHGSDSRPAYLNGALNRFSIKGLYKYTLKTKKELKAVCKFADHIIEAPATTMFFNRRVINELIVGTAQRQLSTRENKKEKDTITILHSPSNPEAKGTFVIRKAIEGLKEEGYKFEYVEMINRTNQQVLDAIVESDFVIDQIYSDKPMAVFATEAAFYGKPSIVGGYEIDKIIATIPPESCPPSYLIKPTKTDLKKAIIHMIEDKEFTKELGKQAQDFVRNNWDAQQVAARFLRIINNDIPKQWYVDPYEMDMIHGCCIEDGKRKDLISKYVKKYGAEALCLADKEALRAKLLEDVKG